MHNDNNNYTQVLSQSIKSNMSTEFCLSTNNEKIWKFFKERHPGLNFEEFVLLFIDLVEKLTEIENRLNVPLKKRLRVTLILRKTKNRKL